MTRINNLAVVSLAHNLTVSRAAPRRFRAPPSRRVLAQTLRPLMIERAGIPDARHFLRLA